MQVKIWTETVIIPTYNIGKPEKNPMFLEKRVYQGSSGVVYPHPVVEKILDEKIDKEWNAVFLENQYLKIMILPELGGRVQMAYDKTKERHFVYYNQVIKPALVGLTGPWISGGIEFNWPQHHRPSTYDPVDYTLEENEDGSATIWCSEVERMFRTRGMAGFTLYPDKAYLEIQVKLYNRTPFPQTFLWWANPAVKVNDHYQSVFPPDVNAVFDHGKRDVSEFPIARGTYYKVDYSPGTDISRYKNIPVPTSYMAITSRYDFVGGYENDSKGGLLHVANHHISPGKKQWTWGNGDFGQAWDRNLTDEDGPYIELMCGVYTDNQPDFSWLMPGEEKSFTQYFMPYRDIGVVKNATRDAMVNLEILNGNILVKAYTTANYPAARVLLSCTDKNNTFLNEPFDFHPGTSYEKMVELPNGCNPERLIVSIETASGKELIAWRTGEEEAKPIPEPARAAAEPSDINTNEQLYFTGLHLEQYRHATRDPRDYYKEALQRDPGDSRCNNALGLLYLKRGDFVHAEQLFAKAIVTLTERNPNPADGEPFYNLGLALRFLGKNSEAEEKFYKSVWNASMQEAGYYQLACLASADKRYEDALGFIDRSMIKNWHNQKTRHLKTALLRKSGRHNEAQKLADETLTIDKFNFGILFENHLLKTENLEIIGILKKLIRGNIHNYIEYSLDYAYAGLMDEAIDLITIGIGESKDQPVYPMAYYYKAWFENLTGNIQAMSKSLSLAAIASPDYCFPHQPEAVIALTLAIEQNPSDYKAHYYLGNFWYNARSYDSAINCWEQSVANYKEFPTAHRNLSLAYYNKKSQPIKALESLEKAFSLGTSDARVFMELDQLYKRLNYSISERLENLEKYHQLLNERDDLYLEHITLLNTRGEYQKAYELLMSRKFHPWEGGEGKVTGQYEYSLVSIGKQCINAGHYTEAIGYIQKAMVYPENLGEGKLFGTRENELLYWLGVALDKSGNKEGARNAFKEASIGLNEVSTAIFYNDQQPDTIFYQGLALMELGNTEEAYKQFRKLVEFGKTHLDDQVKIDYFAVSLPDMLIWDEDLNQRNRMQCNYLLGLGYLGLGDFAAAADFLNKACEINNHHQGVLTHLKMTK